MRALFAALPECRRVLDLGCGTGWVAAEAREPIGSQIQRFGIDYSFEAIHAGKQQHKQIRFACSDGLRLPFPDHTFDVVIGHVSMPYMNTRRALEEVYRVLLPGGSVLLTFHSFRYWRERMKNSARNRNVKDIIFLFYMGANALLNHFTLPQLQAPWRRTLFETVNTKRGVSRTANNCGFILVSLEHCEKGIFFTFTARKPATHAHGAVLAAPAWSSYRPLG